ncbi:hypothetical protein GW17_00039131 [Ensete ventricosum]|nr:hypothetical protein GW17_00039131 [Ensete ventricosum]
MGAVPTSGHCAIGDRPCGHFIVGDHPCGHRATSGPGHWRLPLRAVAPIGDPCRNLTTPVGGLAALVVGLAIERMKETKRLPLQWYQHDGSVQRYSSNRNPKSRNYCV